MVIFAHLIQSASSLPADASALESAISALESSINALETSSVPWENLLPWFTALVAVGVAMEFWVIWREHRDDMGAWKRGTILPPERPSTAKLIIELVSLVFITGGIVGELGIGIKVTSINGALRGKNAELRTASDQLIAFLYVEAADRHITLEQRNKMLAILAARRGTRISVDFVTQPSSSDAQQYSIEIGGVFHDAKWIVISFPWLTSYDVPICGFAVQVREKVASAKRALLEKAVREALTVLDNRITVTYGGTDPGPNMNLDVTVFVGGKCINSPINTNGSLATKP